MDIGRAFTFVFDDPDWVKKVLVGGLIYLLSFLIPIVGFLAGFVLYGYALEVVRRVYSGEQAPLPEWDDIGGYLTRGLVLAAGMFVWLLPVTLLVTCVGGGIIIAGGSTGNDGAAALSSLLAFSVISVSILLMVVWSVIFFPVIAGRYAIERRFGSMFEFGEILADVRRAGIGPLLLLFLTVIVASFVGNLGIIACLIGVIFTTFYSFLVMAHGAGQVYRQARGLPALQPASQATTF